MMTVDNLCSEFRCIRLCCGCRIGNWCHFAATRVLQSKSIYLSQS